jgi:hypothetical protein
LQPTLQPPGDLLTTGGNSSNNSIRTGGHRPGRFGDIASLIVAALALGAGEPLLGRHVADRLGQAALSDLSCDEVVHSVLESVDLAYACYFGFVEVF